MRIVIARDYEHLSCLGAGLVGEAIVRKPDLVLGLATGVTPLGVYRKLGEMYEAGQVDFSRLTVFNLDEYYGLSPADPRSYRSYLERNLFSRVNLRPENIHLVPGQPGNVADACRNYDLAIAAAGGIDLQILGIGQNGHVGFNEPGKSLCVATHLVDLAPQTVEANARSFPDHGAVPGRAVTVGMGAIMKARRILLLAGGREKAAAVAGALSGPVTTAVPASLLQLHRHTTLIVDQAAAGLIRDCTSAAGGSG